MWFKKYKKQIAIIGIICAVLLGSFFLSGNSNNDNGKTENSQTIEQNIDEKQDENKDSKVEEENQEDSKSEEDVSSDTKENTDEKDEKVDTDKKEEPKKTEEKVVSEKKEEPKKEEPKQEIDPKTGKDKYNTDPVPEGKPLPVEPQDATITDKQMTCTLSISCSTILDNMDLCDEAKKELVPENGWILEPITVTFYEGESVFNILQRTCKQQKIHMEFENTPAYNSAYIEGINNIYEFDVGELSGWMYEVNGWFPNYGASRYQVEEGDVINWVYTCDLGKDVGREQ